MADLQEVSQTILRMAQRQGYVVQRDVRAELRVAGLAETEWKTVIGALSEELDYRRGRYYHRNTIVGPRLMQELNQRTRVQKAIKAVVRAHRASRKKDERRGDKRIDFVQSVSVRGEDDKVMTLVCRDLSSTGVRLLGTHRLLGQKVTVELSQGEKAAPLKVVARILWTFAIGDGLYENGGTFLEILEK